MSKTLINDTLDQGESISLKTAGLSILAIVAIISLVMLGAVYANRSRQRAVINQYTKETEELITAHQVAAKEFFSQTFDDCRNVLLEEQKAQKPGDYHTDSTDNCLTASTQLAKLEVRELRDSSATAYVRVIGDKYELIEASGLYNEAMLGKFQSYGRFNSDAATKADLIKYLQQNEPILLWQNFIPYIEGKEVIVPVKIDNQLVGYIFRGVIEK